MKLFATPSIAFGVSLVCAGAAVAQFGNPFEPPRPPEHSALTEPALSEEALRFEAEADRRGGGA